jgi:predicted acyl esterase
MVQVQSSWFPLVDRNPQTFRDIYTAKAEDFKKQTHRVYHGGDHRSKITVRVMP